MIEIPDLDKLTLDSSNSRDNLNNINNAAETPESQPQAAMDSDNGSEIMPLASSLAYVVDSTSVSMNGSTDDYLNDLRAYKFGQTSGFNSERLLTKPRPYQPSNLGEPTSIFNNSMNENDHDVSSSQISFNMPQLKTAEAVSITQSPTQPKFLTSPQLVNSNNDQLDDDEGESQADLVHRELDEEQAREGDTTQQLHEPIHFEHEGNSTTIHEQEKNEAAISNSIRNISNTSSNLNNLHRSPKLNTGRSMEFNSIRRELATDLKTPAEYTLHILFTQFVRHAERKLNLCLDFPLNEEPPIIELLGEGVDAQFDKIIASLGYIARRKPSPVIDSVMFWRKSKSEVASMAALEVERVIHLSRSNPTVNGNNYNGLMISPSNPGIVKNNQNNLDVSNVVAPPTKAKRSLSLMRSKSISKFTGSHKRNQSASTVVGLISGDSNHSGSNVFPSSSSTSKTLDDQFESQVYQARETAIQADRKSLALIYILCRVLIEVVKQTSTETMGEELTSKLEEIVYTQMKTTDPISTSESIVRSSNWNLFAQLLGYMSEKQFVSVSDRFIADLEKIPAHIQQDAEPSLHLLIHGMKYLKLTNYPLEKFEELAEFMQSLGKFFGKSMNESIIYAYCEVLGNLVLPLANILTAETNHPTWVEAIESIFNKAYQIWNHNMKQSTSSFTSSSALSSNNSNFLSGWSYSICLMTSMLAVSRKELFSKAWFEVIEENLFKLKPKVEVFEKTTLITCISRLSWVYLYRLPDSLNNTIKKLDSLFGHLLFNAAVTGKKLQWITTTNPGLINSLIMLMKIVGYQHLNYMLDNVLIRLLKLCFNGFSLENISSERLVLVVKSYLAIIQSYEKGVKPSFPTDEVIAKESENKVKQSRKKFDNRMNYATTNTATNYRDLEGGGVDEFLFIAKNPNNAVSHEEISNSFANLLRLLDGVYGADIWTSENGLITPISTSFSKAGPGMSADVNSSGTTPGSSGGGNASSTGGFFHFGIDFTDQNTKLGQLELFAAIIEAIPWTLVAIGPEKVSSCGIPFKNIVEVLARNAVHPDSKVSNASIKSLRKLATRKNPSSLITIFAKIAFQFSEKPGPNYNSVYLNSPEFHRLLKIYVELLNCWLGQFYYINEKQNESNNKTLNSLTQDDEMMSKDVLNDLYQINYKSDDLSNVEYAHKLKPSDELEWKNIITVIEEVEGNGLFFLCSQDYKTRHFGIYILKIVEHFDQAIYNITDSSRIGKQKSPSPEGSKSHSRNSSKFAADIGTRLIHILEDTDFLELIKPFKNEISIPERSRLSKLKNKKNILVRLAESDYGIDSTLWFRLYPRILDIFFERCPIPVALCRSIVCVRMVQMHEFVLDFADTYKNYTSSLFNRSNHNFGGTPPEVMLNQWKLYLIFAACSLTSTNDQKISFPTQPTHGRKKSMQMYIQHQKITSAKSVFKMVFPLLNSKQPMVRDAVINGLSCLNINIFKTLLENMPDSMNDWVCNNKKRDPSEDRLRIETVHIISNVTSRFQNKMEEIYCDEWIVANLVGIIKNVKTFLSNPLIQTDIEFQKLRRFFCQLLENVFLGIKEISSNNGDLRNGDELDKWLPFEARLGCFNFLKEWCGFGDVADIAEDRYNTMMQKIAKLKELQPQASAILEVERKALQLSSLSCMSKLCSGPIRKEIEVSGKSAVLSFDIPGLQSWIHGLFISDLEFCHEIGKQALRNVLRLNPDYDEIYDNVIYQCYTSQEKNKATESYFTVFAEVFMEQQEKISSNTEGMEQTLPYEVFCLSSLLVGNENYEIRFAAIKLLTFLENKYYGTSALDRFVECVRSRTKVVYKRALYDISVTLANAHPEEAYERISYLTMFFNMVNYTSRRDTLSCILPWVQIVELKDKVDDLFDDDELIGAPPPPPQPLTTRSQLHHGTFINNLDAPSIMILNNLFEITVKFSLAMLNEVEALWVALGSGNAAANFDKIIEYIMSNCLERKNQVFVEFSRQIIDYLAFSQTENLLYIIDKFIANLHPKSMVPPLPKTLSNALDAGDFPYIANLWKLIPHNEKDVTFSLGQLSSVFLVDLFCTQNDRMVEKLPLLLHISFSLLDHYLYIVQEQAGNLLIHLIHSLAGNSESKKVKETVEILRQRDNAKHLWVYDDLNKNGGNGSSNSGRTPKNMDLLVRNILEIFLPIVPGLQEEWSTTSLVWATTCAVRHIACRSFQIFRSLLSFLDQIMLKDMLHRLSNTISDDAIEIQGFAMQILMTLNAITAELDSKKLIDFPQLFWSSVACLSTIHEQEFIEVLSTMSKFVSKIDLDAPDTVSCLISTFPPKWEGKFEGLQQIVLVGLKSATAWEPLLKFLDKMNLLKDSEIIGMGDSRLLMSLLANLPRFLHALEKKKITREIEDSCNLLIKMSDNANKPSLSKILVSLGKNRFRSKKDFLNQTVSTIKVLFFPQYEAQTLVFYLGLLSNKIDWVKLETMNLLKYIFPLVDLTRDEFVGVGADLISPLLRLLLTDFAEPALEVLDESVIISGSQLDKDVLRMLLGNASMKKEYEKTATLFGIPDESGWAIPMPAATAASTRSNVHSVFSTCIVPQQSIIEDDLNGDSGYVTKDRENPNGDSAIRRIESIELTGSGIGPGNFGRIGTFNSGHYYDTPDEDEEIHFHMEDYYGPSIDHNDGESITVGEPDASLSNMWAALDDFDSFLTKDKDQYPTSGGGVTGGVVSSVGGVASSVGGAISNSVSNVLGFNSNVDNYYNKTIGSNARRDQHFPNQSPRVTSNANISSGHFYHGHSASIDTKYSNVLDSVAMDSAPLVYDKKASVILNRSLARTHSNTSFKSSLADSMGGGTNAFGSGNVSLSNFTGNSQPATQGNIPVAKRSYIPFRNSRTIANKNSHSNINSPRSPTLDTVEAGYAASPFRTPRIGSPTTNEGFFSNMPTNTGGSITGPSPKITSTPVAPSLPSNMSINSNGTNLNGNGGNPYGGSSPTVDIVGLPLDSILASGESKKRTRRAP